METVFNNIRAECARRRWSIEELSEKQDFPTSVLVQMAELFDVTTDELLGIN